MSSKPGARVNTLRFRSGLEKQVALQIQGAGHEVRFEDEKVEYVRPESRHKYTRDFRLDNGIIIETKGIFDADDRQKHLLIKAQHPSLDIRFVFTRSASKLYKGSPTSYADWCRKNGFQYADKRIPDAWLKEPPK